MKRFDLSEYWSAIISGDYPAISSFFLPEAHVYWHNTNECFTVDEFVRVNKVYPGLWKAEIQYELRIGEFNEELVICAVRVFSETSGKSFHCCSAIQLHGDLISVINEYWGEDGPPPEWRAEMKIGSPIE